ncbi:MAG: OmpA family protein, partial [Salibacteraceae bacterium]
SHISIVAVNKNEDKLIFYKNEVLYETQKSDNQWSEPKAFPKNINIDGSIQSSACLSDDGNLLIVVSDKENGYGKRDMYISKRGDNGKWSDLENMGSVLNTEQDEDTPFLVGDDLLYFSSKGHSSIGGYDVFYSKLNNGEWTNPQSLGIPINTPQDEISYVRSKKDPQTAFYASARVDGYGYKDVYKINSYYQTKKRDDLPSIAMTDFLSDELKYNEKQKEQEEIAVATTEVVADPLPVPVVKKEGEVKTEPVITKEEPVTTKEEPVVTKKDPVTVDEDIFRDILFKFNGNALTAESEEQVQKIAKFMNDNPEFVVSLGGHADYLGSEETNENISEARALLVVNKLKAAGANPYNIQYAYYGETKPKVNGKNADGSDNSENRAKNRRVEFELEQLALYRVITFGNNSSSIDAKGNAQLNEVANYIKANSTSKITLSGYSDSVGNAEYNKQLSEKRVNETSEKLVSLGVNQTQIKTEFFGEEKPSAPGTNSRRVEIRVN